MGAKERIGNISRRMIGEVDIFDLFGVIKGDEVKKVADYISVYQEKGKVRFAILNVQSLEFVDNNSIKSILHSFCDVKKTILFYQDSDIGEIFKNEASGVIEKFANTEREVVSWLGKELVNEKIPVKFLERRKSVRFQSAVATDVMIRQKDGRKIISTHGIISNLSEQGALIEYLDLHSSNLIQQIDHFKNFDVKLSPHDPFYTMQNLDGDIVRVEISGKQTSLAMKFYTPISLP